MDRPNIELEILDAYIDDVGKHMGRIGFKTFDRIASNVGALLYVKNVITGKKVVILSAPLIRAEEDLKYIRLDSVERKKLNMLCGQKVQVYQLRDDDIEKMGE